MSERIVKILALFLGVCGLIAVLTGVGGVRYGCNTGRWSVSGNATPNENRVIGALFIALALLLARSTRKK